MSDRLDDCLEDSRLLDAHLANCERCVEHERRLVGAQDALVAGFVSASGLPRPSPSPGPPPALRVAPEPVEVEPERAWGALAVIVVLLTLAAIAVVIAGALGVSL